MNEPLYMDGFDEALIGTGLKFNTTVAIYDYERCIAILMNQGMSLEEAEDYFSFNVQGAYVGEATPVILYDRPASPQSTIAMAALACVAVAAASSLLAALLI